VVFRNFGQCNYDIVTFTSKRHFGYTDSVCIIPKEFLLSSADAGADRERGAGVGERRRERPPAREGALRLLLEGVHVDFDGVW
jgi:hypothetical protein